MENNDLLHSGVKGMKWGIRRYQNKDGSLTNAGKKRYNKEMEKLRAEKRVLKTQAATKAKLDKLAAAEKENEELKKSLTAKPKDESKIASHKKMSNEELSRRIERLKLEKEYVDLNKDTTVKGKKVLMAALERSGENLTTQVFNHVGAMALNSVFKKIPQLSKTDDQGNLMDVIYSNNKK